MSIDYEQLKDFVKEAMFTGGGINEPSAPEGIPHRMPAADANNREQDQGDPKANKLYDVALTAREATEKLVEALDEPIYDGAYEHAFKASASLRKVLNSLESSGAHPMPQQRVVAPPRYQQKYTGGSNAGDFAGGAGLGQFAMPVGLAMENVQLGKSGVSKADQARGEKERAQDIAGGKVLQGVDPRERSILVDVEKALTKVADETDLLRFRPELENLIKRILKVAAQDSNLGNDDDAYEI
tara:strand:+ start:580 stop:1302 length:723 start_codon:yes stop_codon:yes gene_type:complete